jgi:ubiquinone/menaquinone biosynthesis C-methylase UbiE
MKAQDMQDASAQVRENIEIHDRIAENFERRHGEIFNEIEQERLRSALARSIGMATSRSSPRVALDVGCGSGNLTRHLLELGLDVVAADVSEKFLDVVRKRFATRRVSTHRLNGTDLRELETGRFDFVAAYSVLHHIPDYLAAVREMARVCKPGGVLYLDHEPTDWYWSGDPAYAAFKAEVSRIDWKKFLVWGNYVGKVRRWFDPRYTNEGDIHVWPDDHVEWAAIEGALGPGWERVLCEDYLLYRRGYRDEVYRRYLGRFADERMMAFRKLAEPEERR